MGLCCVVDAGFCLIWLLLCCCVAGLGCLGCVRCGFFGVVRMVVSLGLLLVAWFVFTVLFGWWFV